VTALYLYEDARARTFEPFASTRPVGTLLAGTAPVWERWQSALQRSCSGFVNVADIADFEQPETPRVVAAGIIPQGAVLAHSRFVPALEVIALRSTSGAGRADAHSRDADANVWRNDGRVAAVRVGRDLQVEALSDPAFSLESAVNEAANGAGGVAEISGWWHDEVWDYIRHLPAQITDDVMRLRQIPGMAARFAEWGPPLHATIMGPHPVIVQGRTDGQADASPAVVEPHVVLDASAGPILIGSGVHVRAFTRISGPCYIGRDSTILGGDVSQSAVGPHCKVRGEVTNTIFLGYANKGHEGFVGHSYLGQWVNLGAGTVTSNLKNTYGAVALWTPSGVRPTGMQFLGTMFGDHAKTGIGLTLTTGTVIGAGANVYDAMPPKAVAPFAWGSAPPYATYRLDKFLEMAARMMSRRQIQMTDAMRRHYSTAHARRWSAEGAES
jgi:UDP-N-acetylglucosamine diphosphorylase/glucosamine-1-phosphate N-acetyltransferase